MSVAFYGNYTRKLYQIWSERALPDNKLSVNLIVHTFQDMEIFPSSSQVHEMIHCANECSKRPNSDYLTFGEFCVYASELKTSYDSKIPRPTPLSKSVKNVRRSSNLCNRRRSNYEGCTPKYEVFLGGSCNPTTWRTDTAIPYLKSNNVSYYNPQVAVWGPELIELENKAKQNADVMFFVIDNQTRSVASMIEASHVAGAQRKLILIVNEFEKPGVVIMGEKITEKEYKELSQGQRYLQDIVERQGIPVFSSIQNALKCSVSIVQKKIKPQDLTIQDASNPVKMAYLQIGDKLLKLAEVFDDLDAEKTGQITLKDVCMAFKILTSTELPLDNLKAVVANQNGLLPDNAKVNETNIDDICVDFNHFCCIMTEFRNQSEKLPQKLDSAKNKASHFLCSVFTPLSKLLHWSRPNHRKCLNENEFSFAPECRNIYLGGTPKPSTWREDVAIPLLKKKGLTYFVPQDGVWSERLVPLEASNIENSQVLLFVIGKNSRALAEMIMAAHYVGLNCQVVLCIQYLEDDTVICGEKMSTQAVKDYNRGRVYLSDIATRSGVPVFEDLSEAVECAVNMC